MRTFFHTKGQLNNTIAQTKMNNSFEILNHRNKDKITPKAVNRPNKDSEREKQASSRDLRNS